MPRPPKVRWEDREQGYYSDVGEQYTDKAGRLRRRPLLLRHPDGRKIPKDDRPAALAALARRLEEIKPRPARDGFPAAQLAEWWLFWMERQVAADKLAQSTYDGHSEMIGAFLAQHDYLRRPADEFKPEDLERIRDAWSEAGRAPNYINRLVASVKACWNWARKRIPSRGNDSTDRPLPAILLAANPFDPVEKVKVGPVPKKYAGRGEAALFLRWVWNHVHPWRKPGGSSRRIGMDTGLAHCDPPKLRPKHHWHRQTLLLIRLVWYTGCRPKEACEARWSDVDWSRGTIRLAKHKTERKTGKERVIFLPPAIQRALRRVHDGEVRHPEHIFAHRHGRNGSQGGDATTGKPWVKDRLQQRIRQWRDAAIADGVPLANRGDNRWHLYRLRHTRASDGLMAGCSAAQVAEVLGNSADVVARVYGHLLDGHVAETARKIARPARKAPAGPPDPSSAA